MQTASTTGQAQMAAQYQQQQQEYKRTHCRNQKQCTQNPRKVARSRSSKANPTPAKKDTNNGTQPPSRTKRTARQSSDANRGSTIDGRTRDNTSGKRKPQQSKARQTRTLRDLGMCGSITTARSMSSGDSRPARKCMVKAAKRGLLGHFACMTANEQQ